jgi:AraC family transcriptional regulator
MNSAVECAIKFMSENYSEPISLENIASSALMSRFHFCRTFGNVTGVTPGRFLSAVRIYQAKRLLMSTGMNVTDIAFAVGYNSLGSFSNHFTDSVGVAPGRFRRLASSGGFALPSTPERPSALGSTVTGVITFPRDCAGARLYLGAFDTPIVQRQPAAAIVVEAPVTSRPVSFRLPGVPLGPWFLRAVAVADNGDPEPWTRRILLVGGSGKMYGSAGGTVHVRIDLRPRRSTDLPILLALPDLEAQLEEMPALTPSPALSRV